MLGILNPYVIGCAALALVGTATGGYLKGRSDGVSVTQGKVAAADAKAAAAAATLAQARAELVAQADTAATQNAAHVAALAAASRPEVRNYYATTPNAARACLDPARVLDIAKADAAVIAAARAASNRPAAVLDTADPVGR